MNTITQDMRYRLSLIQYTDKYGVTKAAIKYKTNIQYIYRWKRCFDGSINSLRDLSTRPRHHPSIPLKKLSSSITCVDVTLILVQSFSGSNLCSVAILAPSQVFTVSSKSKVFWLFIFQIPSIFQKLTNRWIILDSVLRWMSGLSFLPVL